MRSLKELNIEELHEIMERAKELREQGTSYSQIASIIGEEFNVKISRPTVMRWCKGLHNPFNKIKEISLEPSPSLAYIIGVFLGDGSTSKRKDGKYRIKLKVIDKDFAERFQKTLEDLGIKATLGFEHDSTRVDRWYVEGTNKMLFQFLNGPREQLFNVAWKYPREFLQGLFDSEGFPVISAKNTFRVQVALANSDLELLSFTEKLLLEKFGISTRLVQTHKKNTPIVIRGVEYKYNVDMYLLWIYRLSHVQKFAKEIGFTARRKQKKLEDALHLSEMPVIEALKLWHKKYIKGPRGYMKRSLIYSSFHTLSSK
ncbi:LAGLIDADG family homing endonuclease [Thermococcus sibiricus]|uniref:Intein/rRNA intron-related DNA endonuclease n=1 Tax=Thermococcus sibiricus (strain DSM 12597 / MM 739) TaxID=604354 RepID=C6A014_THESM|nr:LAGLIDADG family homing endonuclease [Thermococcus sibiricus]ACS90995.1 Intein/rRNA intron-related DNA endonuclease [Thermococcus sibiricus MM 739]